MTPPSRRHEVPAPPSCPSPDPPYPAMSVIPSVRRLVCLALALSSLPALSQPAATSSTSPASTSPATPRSGDVLTAEDWARLRSSSLTAANAQGAEIFSNLAPSVVFVYTKLKPRGGKPGGFSSGTGSVISQDGLVITNQHVIADAEAIYIALFPPGGRRELTPEDLHQARLLRFDESRDLALIRFVAAPPGLRPMPFGNFGTLRVGEEVHAIGHPLGNQWTYTKGVVSQIRENYAWQDGSGLKRQASVIQTQTPISPGNSGGPLIDGNGRMVGVNSFGAAAPSAQGLNFAVAVSEVEHFLTTQGSRTAQRAGNAQQPQQAPENCPEGKAKVLREYRNSTNDHTFVDLDGDCDGKVDITVRIPDRKELAVRYTVERDGKTVTVFVDLRRSNRIDYSLHDTDGDGIPDRIGVHADGDFKPTSFVPYTGEASVRAVLQQQRRQ